MKDSRYNNFMQRRVPSCLKTFLGASAYAKFTATQQSSSSTNEAYFLLARPAIISYFEQTAEACSDRMLYRQQLHLPLFRKSHLNVSFVNDYVRLYDDHPPGEFYFTRILHNHCDFIRERKNHLSASCDVCD